MDFKDNRNLAIGILLSLLSVLLTSTLFLSYKVVTAESINNDFMVKNQSDKAANGQGFTEGMYTGALRNMAEMNEAYGCVRRGIYQKRVQTAEESSEDILSNRVLEILSNTKAQLTNCNISVFDIPRMSQRDTRVVEQIGKIAEDIDRLIKRLN